MISVDVKIDTPAKKVDHFPVLKIRPQNGQFIVLFSSEKAGIVLSQGGSMYSVGNYRYDWVSDGWEDFNGSITIKNSLNMKE